MREDEQMGKSGTIEGTLKGSNVNSHGVATHGRGKWKKINDPDGSGHFRFKDEGVIKAF